MQASIAIAIAIAIAAHKIDAVLVKVGGKAMGGVAAMDDPPARHDLVRQCQRWLLDIELDLENGSLTLEAVQWALSALRALPLSAPASPESGDQSQQHVRAACSDNNACGMDSGWASVSCIHVKRGDGRKRKGIATAENERRKTGRRFEEGFEWERAGMSAGSPKSTECDDELPELQVDIKIADRGEGGKHMAALIEERLAVPGCAALINLIEHSLLVSLDQHFGEGNGDPYWKIGNAEQEDGDAWLHKWLVNSLLSCPKLPNVEPTEPVSSNADLDWLVAYLAAANSLVFVGLLFEKLVPDVLDCKAGTHFRFLPLVRRAMILEFVSMRVGDHAAVAFLPFMPFTWLESSVEENSGKCFNFTSCSSCYASIWLVLSFISPGYLSACARLMVPRLSVVSINQWRTLLWSQNCGEAVLCALSKTLKDVKVEEPKNAQAWLCALFVKRLHHLSLVATDIILLLNQLCKPSVASVEKGLPEFGYLLLEAISRELCLCVHSHISGPEISDDESGAGLFMENLKCHVLRLWNEALCHISTLAQKHFKLGRSLSTVIFGCCLALPESGSQKECRSAEVMKSLTEYVYGDPFIQICFSSIVCCNQRVVADLLVNSTTLAPFASAEDTSFTRLFMVLSIMRLLTMKGETRMIYELWAQNLTRHALMMDNKQALTRILAVRELLNLSLAWSSHSVSASILKVEEAVHSDGLPSSPVWQCLKNALDNQWLQFLLFLNREDACELGLAALGILQLLPPDSCACPQKVAIRLKRSLGCFFWMLDMFHRHDNANAQISEEQLPDGGNKRWQWVRLIEHVKRVIVQLATSSCASFTLMVNSLLDYSFQEVYWPLTPGSQKCKGLSSGGYTMGNCKTEACNTSIRDNHEMVQNASRGHSSVSLKAVHLGNLLRRTLHQISLCPKHTSHQDVSPSYPISILSTLLADRLRTPHEMPMTVEQYEEVLPKNVSSSRHIFLIDCLHRNPFLFEMLQLIVEKGCSEVFQCIEFIEALLADSISYWHSSHRHHRLCTLETFKGNNDDTMDRMQVFQLIQMISTAGWLPQPLAASSEIISLIDGADMADLLILVWRCMHYALAIGPESWKSYADSVCCTEPPKIVQDDASVGDKKTAAFTEWEGQYFAILRHNVAQVGAHFNQVYPMGQKKRNSD